MIFTEFYVFIKKAAGGLNIKLILYGEMDYMPLGTELHARGEPVFYKGWGS
jgi:hypothetical protein